MSNEKHLTTDELVAVAYLEGAVPVHLHSCEQCRERFTVIGETMRQRPAAGADSLFTQSQLARQRSAIYSKLGERPSHTGRWLWAAVPLAAAAAVLLTVDLPRARVHEVDSTDAVVQSLQVAENGKSLNTTAGSDTLYTDIYESLSAQTPDGVNALTGMFDQQTQATAATNGETKN